MKEQILDPMEIERERGITIKAQTVRLEHEGKNRKKYILNLIDTLGTLILVMKYLGLWLLVKQLY